MESASLLFEASLVASFIAGMIALFAPCCISFLLPAYLGSVFRTRQRVLLMTLIYALGIFIVFLPVVLGVRGLAAWFMLYHDEMFYAGSLLMIAVGIVTLFGIKIPTPGFVVRAQAKQKMENGGSVFLLGIFSGIASSCCAPVLVGVLTFSMLSASFWHSIAIGVLYVTGMVLPLLIGSYFLDRKKVIGRSLFQRRACTLSIGGKTIELSVSQAISGVIFVGMGVLTFILTATGKLEMQGWSSAFSSWISGFVQTLTNLSSTIPALDILIPLGIGTLIAYFIWFAQRRSS